MLKPLSLIIATIATGLSAGFFFTYQASVTMGLAEVDAETYVATFQAINNTIQNPWFAIVFFGSIPAIGLALLAHCREAGSQRCLIAAALAAYVGVLIVTAAGNVPLNDQLAKAASGNPVGAAAARTAFEDDWNRLNLMRTLLSISSFSLLAIATALTPGFGRARERNGSTRRQVPSVSRRVLSY